MRCACTQEGSTNDAKLVLCELHSKEFHRRIEDLRGPDDNAVWNAALDAVEYELLGMSRTPRASNPIDGWIINSIVKLRK